MLCSGEALSELIRLVYQAVQDEAGWQIFLDQLADVFHASDAVLHCQDTSHDRGGFVANGRTDPFYQQQYNAYYGARNEWLIRGRHLLTEGTVALGEEVISPSDLRRTEFYHDWLRPQHILHTMGAIIVRQGALVSICSFVREPHKAPFGDPEKALLAHVLPHMRQALLLRQHVLCLQEVQTALAQALDQLPFGYLLVDQHGRVLLLNRTARRILEQRDGLSLMARGLAATRAEDTTRLHHLVQAAARRLPVRGDMTLLRPSLRRPYTLLVTPIATVAGLHAETRAVAVLFLTDPEQELRLPAQTIAQVLGLTLAEGRLTALLADGQSLQQAAEALEVSQHTARNQLKSIFQKTDTHRQGELVRLVLTSVVQMLEVPQETL